MSKRVLVVAAHADDEALGCGGTIARHASRGDVVHVVFVADGVTSRIGADAQASDARAAAAAAAAKTLGVAHHSFLGFPDNRLDAVALLDVVRPIEERISAFAPERVYTHHAGDLNVDHRITHQAVMTACRALPGSGVRDILAFEVLSSTEWNPSGGLPFVPNVFVDIASHLDAKLQALADYRLEMRRAPHARSIENVQALACHRGASAGLRAAEAFMLLRRTE